MNEPEPEFGSKITNLPPSLREEPVCVSRELGSDDRGIDKMVAERSVRVAI